MGMRKFGSAAPPFSKVACAVKVYREPLTLFLNRTTNDRSTTVTAIQI